MPRCLVCQKIMGVCSCRLPLFFDTIFPSAFALLDLTADFSLCWGSALADFQHNKNILLRHGDAFIACVDLCFAPIYATDREKGFGEKH